ncbi:ribonuclease III [Erythrobacter neustonensis]|uniref:Ribonuclease 3 n=1 Tax=Erythrobacter neustonensis TaxID=1112 RepID=A0A192D6G0_9SPHN|nr:ribonuclease III [Erythrobacter neustonensis]ANK13359.1 ribonuclease III [Erythrobacter neustonensis]
MTAALAPDTRAWLTAQGFAPAADAVWLEALTHGSFNGSGSADAADYQRLEFLGDRVLGLSVAAWLFRAGDAPEGKLSQRLNALVSGATCARIARSIGLPPHIRLGKQARDDGGSDSDKILGDVMEALIGACFIEHGFEAAQTLIYRLWASELEGDVGKSKHPKSALQEWAAGNRRMTPLYEVVDRSGPDHAARFTVRVSVRNVGAAEATASSKGEAEKLAAKAFLEQFG